MRSLLAFWIGGACALTVAVTITPHPERTITPNNDDRIITVQNDDRTIRP